jgi:hypothetical protein
VFHQLNRLRDVRGFFSSRPYLGRDKIHPLNI